MRRNRGRSRWHRTRSPEERRRDTEELWSMMDGRLPRGPRVDPALVAELNVSIEGRVTYVPRIDPALSDELWAMVDGRIPRS